METTQTRRKRRHHRRHRRETYSLLIVLVVTLVATACLGRVLLDRYYDREDGSTVVSGEFGEAMEAFAEQHDLPMNAWPQEMVDAVANNPELGQFVLNYPIKKDKDPVIDLSQYRNTDTVPLLFQWDERWGYSDYSGGIMGFTGCGPTCLSMVSIYLRNNPDLTPRYIAEFSESHGYSAPGSGSKWALISEGGKELGMDVKELPLDRNLVMRNLEEGNPIICVMGPGDFTTNGHFIVMTGCEDGKIRVNDPNSKERSERLWDYDQIQGQIKNLWVFN